MESRCLLAFLTVNTTSDAVVPTDPTLSLREAIEVTNGTLAVSALSAQAQAQISGSFNTPDTIQFAIPASTAPLLNIAVPGFDPGTQTWTIQPLTPLPMIAAQVTIDGYTQAQDGVPFQYPSGISSAVQEVDIVGSPTSGTFSITTASPLPNATFIFAYNDPVASVQSLSEFRDSRYGQTCPSPEPLRRLDYVVTFTGAYAGQTIPKFVATSSLTGARSSPGVAVNTTTLPSVAW